MKPNTNFAAISLALMVVSMSGAMAADAQNADQILRQMSAKLSAAKQFSFTAHREIDPALLEGTPLAKNARVETRVLRPNKLAAHATTNRGARRFIADGSHLTLLDEKANTYATLPMRTNIDGVVTALDEKYGFTPPLAEFAVSNPYAELHREAQTVTYLGKEKIGAGVLGLGGIECHRLGLKGQAADAELWIAVSDQLPRKLVATFHRTGQPQVRVAFSNWNLAAPVTASDFAFTPPKGSEKIEMWTPAQMASAGKKTAAKKH